MRIFLQIFVSCCFVLPLMAGDAVAQEPTREKLIVLRAVEEAATERSSNDGHQDEVARFCGLVVTHVEQALSERSEPLIFPYAEFKNPSEVALEIMRDAYGVYLDFGAHTPDEMVAEAIARDYVQRLYQAERYGAAMPDTEGQQVIRTQLDELRSYLIELLSAVDPEWKKEDLSPIVEKAMEKYYVGLTDPTTPFAKEPLSAKATQKIRRAWDVEAPEMLQKSLTGMPQSRSSGSDFIIKDQTRLVVEVTARRVLRHLSQAYREQWKEVIPEPDERLMELQRKLASRAGILRSKRR